MITTEINNTNSSAVPSPEADTLPRIAAISISDVKGIPKTNVASAILKENHGIEGDAHAGDWHRQVSLLSLDSIESMKAKGLVNLQPGIFAENITVANLQVALLPVGARLSIGKSAIIEITQIGKECHTRCGIYKAAGDCVMPREGIFAKVIIGGEIIVNDIINVLQEPM